MLLSTETFCTEMPLSGIPGAGVGTRNGLAAPLRHVSDELNSVGPWRISRAVFMSERADPERIKPVLCSREIMEMLKMVGN